MSNWVDFLFVGIVLSILVGVGFAVITINSKVQDTIKTTKKSLNDQGVAITSTGVAVKTNKSMNREDYIDATQRAFLKGMSAASVGNPDSQISLAGLDKPIHIPHESKSNAKKWSLRGKSKA